MLENKRKVNHPGVYIKDAIEELGLNQSEFALRSGLSIKNVSTLISGESRITVDVALRLAAFFHNSVEGWINLQTKYDVYISEQKIEESLRNEWKVAKQFKNDFTAKLLNIEIDSNNKEKTIEELRRAFSVGTLEALKQPDMYAFYKTSIKKDLTETNIIMRNAWISLAEQVARKKTCNEFNKETIINNRLFLRQLTTKEPNEAFPKLESTLNKAGIKLIILPYLKNSLVGGVTKWIQNENCVLVAINDCGKDADKIWFSIFHEIGHAIKNHKRHLTISYSKDSIEDEDEIDANKFARELLIDENEYIEFVKKGHFDLNSIISFSKQQKVADFVVIGRLQKEGIIPWTKYSERKIKYSVLY